MAALDRLVQTDELQVRRLTEATRGAERPQAYSVRYHDTFDALLILLIQPQHETIVHYVDDYVGLVYEAVTMEIVGLQIEAFERAFLP
jgi:hypothetical protein